MRVWWVLGSHRTGSGLLWWGCEAVLCRLFRNSTRAKGSQDPAWGGLAEVVKELPGAAADTEAAENTGDEPLRYAAYSGHSEAVKEPPAE